MRAVSSQSAQCCVNGHFVFAECEKIQHTVNMEDS